MGVTAGQTLLNYRFVETIGEGGMGVVWKAIDTSLDREVAIKILPASLAGDPERLARFEREAKVLASLNHTNVATVHGFHEAGGERFLVMELVPGETLEERLRRGAVPVDEAIPIARKIVDGVEYAHERSIVHRDLKPANVKLTPDGGLKVLDFGLAKAIAGDSGSSPTSTPTVLPTLTSMGTVAGMILGTAAYMSPEQARGVGVDRRSDIWAFGALLFEMLTGRRAFEGETISDTLASVLRAPVEWEALPASTPPRVVGLLRRCLERDPKKRLRDIGEARIVLDATDDDAAPAPAASPQAMRSGLPWLLFATAALVAIALGAAALLRTPPEARVVRFDIPVDTRLQRFDWPRLSPDGKMLAFQGIDSGGKTTIWVRPMDAATPYPLPGTEGVTGRPWWSPDSKYLAYFESRQLKKIPIAGGPPQTIGEAENGSDGSWSTTGIIAFDGRTAVDSIRQIPAAGGIATSIFGGKTLKDVPNAAWPVFLPDGKHFLFTAGDQLGGSAGTICVGDVGTADAKKLTASDSRVEFANGYIVYVLHGTLVAQKFDVDKLALSGDPVPLADRVSNVAGRALFSVSSTGAIAYLAGATGETSEIVWIDRSGKELGKVGPPGVYSDAVLSPDGTKVAFSVRDDRDGTLDVWVRDLARDTASKLTFDAADDGRPVWSADGSRVYYATNRDAGIYEIYTKAANGIGAETLLYKDRDHHVCPEGSSPDGKHLIVDLYGLGLPIAAASISTDGTGEPAVLPGTVNQGAAKLSPDGHYMTYVSNETKVNEVYVQTWPPGGGKWQISSGGGLGPRWRADGKELFYRTADFEFFAVSVNLGPPFTAGMPKSLFKRRIVTGAVGTQAWSVASDGQRFLLNAPIGNASPVGFSVILNWPETLRAR